MSCAVFLPTRLKPSTRKSSKFLVARSSHPLQLAELDPVRVRLDRNRAGDDFLADPFERERLIVKFHPEPGVGVDDRSVPEIFDQLFLRRHRALELDLDARPVDPVPFELLAGR